MPYVTAIERMGEERGILLGRRQGILEGKQQGILEGKRQGILEGKQQGEVRILKRQMSRQYGPLPGWVEERLATASVDDLERWADRVLDAASIEEVFGSNGA